MNSNEGAKQGQTTNQMEQLDKLISVLSESIEHLKNVLSRVLRDPPPPVNIENKKEPAEELVPLANSIRLVGWRVATLNDDVQDILNRLEL
jgi:hypothetical protein